MKHNTTNTNPYGAGQWPIPGNEGAMVIETNVLAGPSTVTGPGRPKTRPPTGLFPMSGDKTTLLENPVLAEPLRAAMKAPNYKRFIDAFTGTTSIATWVAKEGIIGLVFS